MVIVDSSVIIDFLGGRRNPQTDWLKLHLDTQEIGITSLIQSEVLQGVRSDKRFGEVEEALNQFSIFDSFGSALAISSAQNYRRLRGLGITPRNLIDTFVATFCIEFGHDLLHRDRDFDGFQAHLGLSVVDHSKIAAD